MELKTLNDMLELRFFPIYGATIGFNYWNTYMDFDEEELEEDDEIINIFQIFFLLFGISFIWYK